jgi:hypothetical protein
VNLSAELYVDELVADAQIVGLFHDLVHAACDVAVVLRCLEACEGARALREWP